MIGLLSWTKWKQISVWMYWILKFRGDVSYGKLSNELTRSFGQFCFSLALTHRLCLSVARYVSVYPHYTKCICVCEAVYRCIGVLVCVCSHARKCSCFDSSNCFVPFKNSLKFNKYSVWFWYAFQNFIRCDFRNKNQSFFASHHKYVWSDLISTFPTKFNNYCIWLSIDYCCMKFIVP